LLSFVEKSVGLWYNHQYGKKDYEKTFGQHFCIYSEKFFLSASDSGASRRFADSFSA